MADWVWIWMTENIPWQNLSRNETCLRWHARGNVVLRTQIPAKNKGSCHCLKPQAGRLCGPKLSPCWHTSTSLCARQPIISATMIRIWPPKQEYKEMVLYSRAVLISVFAIFFSLISFTSANAAACRSNNWQPTFVHDLRFADGPWYVMPNGSFLKLRIKNRNWVGHACNLIGRLGIRNRSGYTNCRAYTRIQCGCQRGLRNLHQRPQTA